MKNFKKKALIFTLGNLLFIGCASTPMIKLKPSEMITAPKNKYLKMETSEGLSGWEKGLWEYQHKNYLQARKLLEPYKTKDIAMVQHAFGVMYTNGTGGLTRNFKKAEDFYKKAIKIDNYPNSLHNLAVLYFNGWGSLSRSDNKILELYQEAAQSGYSLSQFSLGDIYHFGRNGFPKDLGKAYYWYQQASNQGHAKAARRIGYMYENGEGFKKNIEQAFHWYKIAAERGNKHSKSDAIRLKSILYKKNKTVKEEILNTKKVSKDRPNTSTSKELPTSQITCSITESSKRMMTTIGKMQKLKDNADISMEEYMEFNSEHEKILPLVATKPSKYCNELNIITKKYIKE